MNIKDALFHFDPPFLFDPCGEPYIVDSKGIMVAQVRGWGKLSTELGEEKAEMVQDVIGKFIAEKFNEVLKK